MEQQHQAIMRRRSEEARGEKRDLDGSRAEGEPKKVMIGELEVIQEDDGADEELLHEQYFDEKTGRELDPEKELKAKRE